MSATASKSSLQGSVSYDRYSKVFECILPHFEQYERICFAAAYTLGLFALLTQAFATLLHTQDTAFFGGSVIESRRLGYIVGFIATFIAGLNVLLPFSHSATKCREISGVIARYLLTKEDVPVRVIYKIFDVDTLCFRHPTAFPGCSIQEICSGENTALLGKRVTLKDTHRNGKGTEGLTQPKKNRSISFTQYSQLLVCASADFNRYAEMLLLVYYVLVILQLVFTIVTSVFHGDAANLFGGRETTSLIGLVCGFFGTVTGGIVTIVPIQAAAIRCKASYSTCNEYLISEEDMSLNDIEMLYKTPCLCFINPLMRDKCNALIDVAVD